jgi:hypothetical protein
MQTPCEHLVGAAWMSDVKMAQYWQESPVDDEQSLALAVKRDSAAFGELYQRYVKRIYAYLYTNLGNQAEAEDLTTQVFLSAWRGLSRYNERGAFKSWLFRIARNKVIDYHRKRQVDLPLEDDLLKAGNDWDPLKHLEQAGGSQKAGSGGEETACGAGGIPAPAFYRRSQLCPDWQSGRKARGCSPHGNHPLTGTLAGRMGAG